MSYRSRALPAMPSFKSTFFHIFIVGVCRGVSSQACCDTPLFIVLTFIARGLRALLYPTSLFREPGSEPFLSRFFVIDNFYIVP